MFNISTIIIQADFLAILQKIAYLQKVNEGLDLFRFIEHLLSHIFVYFK